MSERITLDADFLRRALGFGREGDPADVVVTPGALPTDFPITLPEWAGMQVLGGIRSVAPRWTFYYRRSAPELSPEYLMWRVFLDVPLPLVQVMWELTQSLLRQGWRPSQMHRQAIVEAVREQWEGVHPKQGRTLTLAAREAEGVTQVWLGVQDRDPRQLDHLQGLNVNTAEDSLALPTLLAPVGARVDWQGGGDVRQEAALVTGSEFPALLTQFAAQLEGQEGPILHRHVAGNRAEVLVQGREGPVLLTLELAPAGVQVHLLKIAGGGEARA
ncbi:hypothetical protein Dcar01_00303 [Deinococcus carri]|uniref:Uncharacterized protein n=1 Tax=Deinococcus carri TaxID=1211323 RepID=A0ABP9W2L4_9DEIO